MEIVLRECVDESLGVEYYTDDLVFYVIKALERLRWRWF